MQGKIKPSFILATLFAIVEGIGAEAAADNLPLHQRGSLSSTVLAYVDPAQAKELKELNYWVVVDTPQGQGFIAKDVWLAAQNINSNNSNNLSSVPFAIWGEQAEQPIFDLYSETSNTSANLGPIFASQIHLLKLSRNWVYVSSIDGQGYIPRQEWDDALSVTPDQGRRTIVQSVKPSPPAQASALSPHSREDVQKSALDPTRAQPPSPKSQTRKPAALIIDRSASNNYSSLFIKVENTTMYVYRNGALTHTWPVGTGRTPAHHPQVGRVPNPPERIHYSHRYHNAPLPYAIHLWGDYFIHQGATGAGRSHGCIHLQQQNAAELFQEVENVGYGHVTYQVM